MIAINIDGQIKVYSKLPKSWGNYHNIKADSELVYDLGFREVVKPEPSETQKLGVIEYDSVNDVFTYPLIDKTPEELEAEAAAKKQMEAQKIKEAKLKAYVESVLTPEERLQYYPEWKAGSYAVGVKVAYKLKTFENTIEGNINAPDKGGWTEIK